MFQRDGVHHQHPDGQSRHAHQQVLWKTDDSPRQILEQEEDQDVVSSFLWKISELFQAGAEIQHFQHEDRHEVEAGEEARCREPVGLEDPGGLQHTEL